MAHEQKIIRKARDYRWDGVDVLPYKEDARALYRAITRQVLFTDPNLHAELRYFEIAPGGFSTLERHEHMHAVLILRGRGHCLVGTRVSAVELRDLVTVPPLTWHQFRAGADDPLGFLCMVDAVRDKPQLPSPDDLAQLKEHPQVAAFLSGPIRRTEHGGRSTDKERSARSSVLPHSSSGE
jgi:mannose-6-phosphate isomerase-like protein (cupin superfamily)